ncbi:MFS transporter [Humibacter albus]|uniref:MFS transporter n=1 Tax=Humibacter albus TaxID=427754 RepID=UPI0003B48B08|nr:MFS transporter [Humibacter albus]
MRDKQQNTRSGSPRWLTLGVFSVGATSFLSDAGHELVTSVLPAFLTSVLGVGAAALGIIDGVADALTGLAKLAGGPLADDPRRRRAIASAGYTTTAVTTAAIGLTTAAWQVGVLRGVAWIARGFRSPARDSMLASLAASGAYGRAYGIERAGDNLGAVVGPLLGGLLVVWLGLRPAILLSVVPGLLAAVAIGVAAHQAHKLVAASRASGASAEPGRPGTGSTRITRAGIMAGYRRLRGTRLSHALIPVALFEGGNLAATLLILRAYQFFLDGGMTEPQATVLATVLYAAYNAAAALIAVPAGALIDRIGPRRVLALGAAAYVLGYLGFAFLDVTGLGGATRNASPAGATSDAWLIVLVCFVLGGLGIGLGETAQSTLVAHALPDALRGSGFGLLGLVQAGGDVTATIIGGIVYATVGPLWAFAYAAAWMGASCAVAYAGRHHDDAPVPAD